MNNDEKYIKPVHAGEILLTEFMQPLEISQNKLARDIAVPPRRINEIVHGKRAITVDTAIRLSLYFGTTAKFWLNLQTEYELDSIVYAERIGERKPLDFIKTITQKVAVL